jgi:hypothetical protein
MGIYVSASYQNGREEVVFLDKEYFSRIDPTIPFSGLSGLVYEEYLNKVNNTGLARGSEPRLDQKTAKDTVQDWKYKFRAGNVLIRFWDDP